ncbi:amidinotransferase [Paenibacillus sp. CAA11]|uniref:dimethylarginine dimethylaminohydrolase family protein n=1 Tax=Paenibacillus sp. CAA11 TaxID=1532905 RepID=UPI000D3A82B3|nr:arginine deiminase family protein [Paenibacillus sp. CAA11]AWB42997.1 amidinotransferase [Paenibacillus sp. CAA11]
MHYKFPYLSRKLVSEDSHNRMLMETIWGQNFGVDNPTGQIRQVLMHRPGHEITKLHEQSGQIESGPLLLHQIKGNTHNNSPSELPDPALVKAQHKALTRALEKEGAEIVYLEGQTDPWPEAMFTRDLGMMIPGGVILSRFTLYIRYGETRLAEQTFSRFGVPILGTVQGGGFAEGGSFIMLDKHTAVIGRSERVNPEGIQQIKQILSIQNIELIAVELPASIIHLDEAFLMVDQNKALVNIALLPFWFLDGLHQRHIEMLHVDPRDPALAINGLAVAPGRVLFSSSGKYTMDLLSHHGIEVIPVDISEIEKLGGGIHCCTLPLLRDSLL